MLRAVQCMGAGDNLYEKKWNLAKSWNLAGNLVGGGFGRIQEKWPYAGPAEARAEIWCIPTLDALWDI